MIHVFGHDANNLAERVRQHGASALPIEDHARLDELLPEIEVLLVAQVPAVDWARARALRLVQTMGAGVDELLRVVPPPPEVPLATVKGVFVNEVAEYVVGALLSFVRGFPQHAQRQAERSWHPWASATLAGKHACLVGAGAIGRQVAHVLDALGVTVDAIVRAPRRIPPLRRVVAAEDRFSVLTGADVLVICAPLTPATRGLIGAHELAVLARDAVIVNVARGGIVDEAQLLGSLEQGALGGAVLDVFEHEPLPEDSPWWTAPNTQITPHVAGLGRDYVGRCIERLLENVRRLDAGEPPLGLYDAAVGY